MKLKTLLAAAAFALPLAAQAQGAAGGTGVDRTNTPTSPTEVSPEGSPPATNAGRAPRRTDGAAGNADVPLNTDRRNPSSGDGAGGTTAGSGTDPQMTPNSRRGSDRAPRSSVPADSSTGSTTAPGAPVTAPNSGKY
jgi:hypothetical protein